MLRVQAVAGSAVPGVTFNRRTGRWRVHTLAQWGTRRLLVSVASLEGAEAIAKAYLPSLEAAAAEGRLAQEVPVVKAELKVR